MSLDWNITRVKNHETLCFRGEGEDRRLSARTDALIWMTMFVGIERITLENWRDFYTRVRIHERLFGCLVVKVTNNFVPMRQDELCKPEDVEAHIGLSTNADRLTDLQFDKKIMKRLREEVRGSLPVRRDENS